MVLAGASVPVLAQQATPVTSVGQSSPGLALPPSVESTGLRREAMSPLAGPTGNTGAEGPWWEASEAIALDSMKNNPVKIGAAVVTGWEHDDNVFLSDIVDGKASSYFVRPAASLGYEGGAVTAIAKYSGEYRVYDGAGLDDTFNQVFNGELNYKTSKTKAGVDVNFAQTDGANVEVGERIDSIALITGAHAAYDVSPKTTLGVFTEWRHMDYDNFNGYDRYAAGLFVDYKVTVKTTMGIGGGYEYTDSETGADANTYDLKGRVAWQVTDKTTVRGSAGVEQREFDGGNSITAPVFSVGMLYTPRDTTSLSVDAYRRNIPSISEDNQSFYATGAALSFNQTILGRIGVGLSGGYEISEYESSVSSVSTSREDDYFFVRPTLSYSIRDWATFSVYYQYSQNDSSAQSSFERNMVGATVGVSF